MNTNNKQIGFPTESRSVVNPTLNPKVTSVSANILQDIVTNNYKAREFLIIKNLWGNNMLDNDENEVYGCIYKITNLMDNKCYIGQTTENNYEKYIDNHFKYAFNNKDNGDRYFYNSIRKYGKKNFKWEILGFCDSLEELNEAEIEAIWFFRSFGSDGEIMDSVYGYNLTKGGGGSSGLKHTEETKKQMSISNTGKKRTEETKKKISESKKGTPSSRKGKKLSEDTKKKIGIANTGKKHTEETKKKMSESRTGENNNFYGKEHTDESKKKMSDALRGREFTEETKKKMSVAQSGENNNFYGKTHTEETKKKMSVAQSGENNPNWGKKRTEEHKRILSELKQGANNYGAKKWKLTDPNNKEYFINGTLASFCKEHNISFYILRRNKDITINKVGSKTERCLNTLGWKLEEI